jgi:hypothetical protein
MYRVAGFGIAVCLLLTECAIAPVQPQKVQYLKSPVPRPAAVGQTFTLPGPVYIPEFYGWSTAAAVGNIVLTLARDAPAGKTRWSLRYDYYNGSWTWEWKQELDIRFADLNGMIVTPLHITTSTPSQHCIYNYKPLRVTDHGAFDFDFTQAKVLLVAGGRTTVGPSSAREDHKC